MHAKTWLVCGGLCGAMGVAMGAFGSHALQDKLTPERLATWEIAVRYQMYHALALLVVGVLARYQPQPELSTAGFSFLAGVFIFSGCLYALCLTGVRMLGAIVPIGGVALIVGWLALAWAAWRIRCERG